LSSLIIIREIKLKKIRWAACMGDMRNAYNIFVGKHEGKRPIGRPRRRW
jgi:hypothetical protein